MADSMVVLSKLQNAKFSVRTTETSLVIYVAPHPVQEDDWGGSLAGPPGHLA